MSGSGKASALKAFEDLGYYCVDNLPVELIPRFAELALAVGRNSAHRAGRRCARRHATRKAAGHPEVGQADDPDPRHLSRSDRSRSAPPLQRDAPPASARNEHHRARVAHDRTPPSARHSRHRRPRHRHFEVQRARAARRTSPTASSTPRERSRRCSSPASASDSNTACPTTPT